MVRITHIRLDGRGTGPEHIEMLRWRRSLGDTGIADMIRWIEGGGQALVGDDEHAEPVRVVREPGRRPYLQTVVDGRPTDLLVSLPRF
jgi:hypothetical protein